MTLTPQDIQNPARISGYDHVGYNAEADKPRPKKPYQGVAYGGSRSKAGMAWIGPRRATAEEAAQDYCDYMNGNGVTPAPRVKSAGHKGKRDGLRRDAELEAALGLIRDRRGENEGKQGYVYCIGEAEGVAPLVKIGYSTNPEARVAELQTGNGRHLFLLGYFAGTIEDEKALHAKYIKDNTLAEWFRPSDALLGEFGYDLYDLYERGSDSVRAAC